MGTLYIVATPIGNVKDITLRALENLKEVDIILAEDTRITKKLLAYYKIHTPLKSYHQHSSEKIHDFVARELEKGKSIALVTDAGTPGISDPGPRLIRHLQLTTHNFQLVPIPGPSALITALSASGASADSFTFLGYPPHKKRRKNFFQNLKTIQTRPIVFYESPHRLQKALQALKDVGEKKVVVAKELTKIHEELWRGTPKEAEEYFFGEKAGKKSKGEFIIIVP